MDTLKAIWQNSLKLLEGKIFLAQKSKNFILLFGWYFPETLLWLGKMQFWQVRWKFSARSQKHFCWNSKNITIRLSFSTKYVLWSRRKHFWQPGRTVFCESPKTNVYLLDVFKKKSPMIFLWTPGKLFWLLGLKIFRECPKINCTVSENNFLKRSCFWIISHKLFLHLYSLMFSFCGLLQLGFFDVHKDQFFLQHFSQQTFIW